MNRIYTVAAKCRDRLKEDKYFRRISALSQEERELVEFFQAGLPLDELVDRYVQRIRGSRSGQPTKADLEWAQVKVMNLIRQVRKRLDL